MGLEDLKATDFFEGPVFVSCHIPLISTGSCTDFPCWVDCTALLCLFCCCGLLFPFLSAAADGLVSVADG